MTWPDRTVLITGASRGVGLRLAEHFAPKCGRIFLIARDGGAVRDLCTRLNAGGATAIAIKLDLRDADAVSRCAESVLCDPIDVVIHNAADTTSKPFRETSCAEIDSLVRTNITGPLQLTRSLLPGMLQRGGGTIVHLSSLAGYKPNPAQTVYSATKGGVNAMSDALRRELGPLGINVANLALPSIALDGDPERRAGTIPVARVAAQIEAIVDQRRRGDVFFSPVSRWLMRAYRAFPALGELRT